MKSFQNSHFDAKLRLGLWRHFDIDDFTGIHSAHLDVGAILQPAQFLELRDYFEIFRKELSPITNHEKSHSEQQYPNN